MIISSLITLDNFSINYHCIQRSHHPYTLCCISLHYYFLCNSMIHASFYMHHDFLVWDGEWLLLCLWHNQYLISINISFYHFRPHDRIADITIFVSYFKFGFSQASICHWFVYYKMLEYIYLQHKFIVCVYLLVSINFQTSGYYCWLSLVLK